jgi:hypothetical protein
MSTAHFVGIRVRRLLWVGIAVLGLLILLAAATAQPLSSQGYSLAEIGLDDYQFVGRIDQDGTEFIGYGYLYDVQGIPPTELFSNPLNVSEATAHLTYYATATLSARAVITDAVRAIFALDSVGEVTYYYQSYPSASFDNPQSFAYGTAVTTAAVRFQDILSVQAPNRGRSVGNGEFAVTTAEAFSLGGEMVRFGRVGRVYQVSTLGDAVRTDPVIPQSSVLLAGNAVHSGFLQTFLPYLTK